MAEIEDDLWIGEKDIHIVMDNLEPSTPMAAFTDLTDAQNHLTRVRAMSVYQKAYVAHCKLSTHPASDAARIARELILYDAVTAESDDPLYGWIAREIG